MRNYDTIDPEKYEKMYDLIPRESYMKTHWRSLIEDTIKRYCKDKNVLDLGCGYGKFLGVIGQVAKNVTGLDISQRWLDEAKRRYPNIKLVLGDALKTSFNENFFDVIITIGLFEYVDRKIVMKEMNRILKKNGFCIISVPNKYSAFRTVGKFITKIPGGKSVTDEPSKKEMMRLFKDDGFRLIEYKMDDGLVWLPNFLDRLCGPKVYKLVEKFFKIFSQNPFSNIMLFVVKK